MTTLMTKPLTQKSSPASTANNMADTKKLYCDTLLRLCETQPLNRITVTALIKETHTARQTFYNNFRDMNDLVSYIPISHLVQSGLPINTVENIRSRLRVRTASQGVFPTAARSCRPEQLPRHDPRVASASELRATPEPESFARRKALGSLQDRCLSLRNRRRPPAMAGRW